MTAGDPLALEILAYLWASERAGHPPVPRDQLLHDCGVAWPRATVDRALTVLLGDNLARRQGGQALPHRGRPRRCIALTPAGAAIAADLPPLDPAVAVFEAATTRCCLRCRADFTSTGRHNHLCGPCRTTNAQRDAGAGYAIGRHI